MQIITRNRTAVNSIVTILQIIPPVRREVNAVDPGPAGPVRD